jgi:hypothetical protein
VPRHQLERQSLLPWSNSRMSNCTLLHTASAVLQLDQCLSQSPSLLLRCASSSST